MIFSFILLLFVWLLPIKANPICNQREQSQMLKFIASLIVVIGHQSAFYCSANETFRRETGLGDFCVSFFLFMSGYGLLFSLVKKNQLLSFAWLKKRMVKLTVPAFTAMFLYVLVEVLLNKEVDWENLFTYWFVSDVNLRYGWYVSEIIVLYMAFFACYKYFSQKRATLLLCLSILIAMIIMLAIKCAIWYVLALPCFVAGLMLAKCDVESKSCSARLSNLQIKMVMSVVVVLFYLLKDFDYVQQVLPTLDKWRYTLLAKFAANIVCVGIVSYILMRLPVCKVMVNRGGYFYEVYLVQGATLLVCREWITNDWLFVILGLLCTIIVAKGMSMVNSWIVKRV